jgi:putative ABC transport system substrate-binding protein
MLWGEGDPGAPFEARATEELARRAGIELRAFSFPDATSLERVLVSVRQMQAQLLVVISGPLPLTHRKRITAFATEARIPLMSEGREWAEGGALLAYGPDGADVFRRAATYIDRILRGAKAAELPIEQPNKFELVINRATAKAIDLKVPDSLLLRADVVIP